MVFENTVNPIFKNKGVFGTKYVPKTIIHREEEIRQIESCLSYILNNSTPVSQRINGLRGTGKTLISRYVTEELCKKTPNVKVYYISLKNSKTEFKAIEDIVREVVGKKVRGISFKDALRTVLDYIKTLDEKYIIFILDEVNEVREPDGFLHSLLRVNEIYGDLGGKELAYIFITNDMKFPENLSPGTASTWTSVYKYTFGPYDAHQLKDILDERAREGLHEGVFDDMILKLCAAYGAQERGDARETILLLEKAAEMALQNSKTKITEDLVKEARKLVESDGTMSTVRKLTPQLKSLALACVRTHRLSLIKPEHLCMTGTVYSEYKTINTKIGIEVLTQRRITDFLDDLKSIGFITSRIVYSRGRTQHIELLVSHDLAEKIILEDSYFDALK